MSGRPFVRVYHDDLMLDYAEVWADDAALATWLRLLVLVDKVWPTPPDLPRSAQGRGLRKLLAAGLVEKASKHTFRIKGYDHERQSRQDAARNAAAKRWQSEGSAAAHANAMPNARAPVPVPVPNTKEKNGVNPREKTTTLRGGLEPVASILPRVR